MYWSVGVSYSKDRLLTRKRFAGNVALRYRG